MTRYIDKDALVVEIEKYYKEYLKKAKTFVDDANYWMGKADAYRYILVILNTLEVKDVDLDKAIDDYIYTHDGRNRLALELDWKYCNLTLKGGNEIIKFAKHFFELGLLSTITEEDCKLIWNIGDDLPYMPEEDFFKELLRRYKARKGE